MKGGEKKYEYRENTKYWRSRLYKKDGTLKEFKYVEFSNGYQKDRPQFNLNANFRDLTKSKKSVKNIGQVSKRIIRRKQKGISRSSWAKFDRKIFYIFFLPDKLFLFF